MNRLHENVSLRSKTNSLAGNPFIFLRHRYVSGREGEQFLPRISQTVTGHIIDLEKTPGQTFLIQIVHENGVVDALEKDTVLILVLPQGLFFPLAH